jgi:hypothetical protein
MVVIDNPVGGFCSESKAQTSIAFADGSSAVSFLVSAGFIKVWVVAGDLSFVGIGVDQQVVIVFNGFWVASRSRVFVFLRAFVTVGVDFAGGVDWILRWSFTFESFVPDGHAPATVVTVFAEGGVWLSVKDHLFQLSKSSEAVEYVLSGDQVGVLGFGSADD